jgi:hypothetical protein
MPANAAIDQYCDALHPPQRVRRAAAAEPAAAMPARTRDALRRGGASGRRALAFARIRGVADARVPEPGPVAGGGFVAALAGLALGTAGLAFAAHRARSAPG